MSSSSSSDEADRGDVVAELREQIERLRQERDQLLDRQLRIAELLKSPDPGKILHDLRNVLNELQLYKLLSEPDSPKS